jgi:hypothetical protein
MKHLEAANGVPMLILCIIVVSVVICQPIIMSSMARKRAKELGITDKELMKVVKSSIVFALLPSMPILASYLVLVPALGKFFPWMRLSVVGSVTYETTVAGMAASTFGFSDIYTADLPLNVFFSILLILTIGILAGNIFNFFFLKSYDKVIKKVMTKNIKLVPILTSAIFVALYSVLSTPTVTDSTKPVGIITFFVTGISAIVLNTVTKNRPKLKENAFSLSLLAGMIFACLINPLFK